MSAFRKFGFTIVETMMFLGVSGLLAAAVLVGTGVSLNTQHYRDSARSLQSMIQQQYNEVSNVINESTTNSCGALPSSPRGQSNCVVMGKYITTSPAGDSFIVKNVIGTIPLSASPTNDYQSITNYGVVATSVGSSTYDMDWGTSVVNAGSSTPFPLSMLIIRSPISGTIHTFIKNTSPIISDSSLATLLTVTPPSSIPASVGRTALLCIEPNGLSSGNRMAVRVSAGASTGSDVMILGDDSGC